MLVKSSLELLYQILVIPHFNMIEIYTFGVDILHFTPEYKYTQK